MLTASLFSEEHASASARRRLTERADDLLGQLGLEGRGDDMPATMSGGERQRVAIARALLFEPELLLCDEPTGNLDAVTGQQIIDVFARLHREQGVTVIAVTHEQRVVDAATRAIEMHGGQLDGVSDLASSSTPGGKEA